MKVLTLTTLFPNHVQPNHGVFIRNRIAALARFAEVKVVAPVPWVPAFATGKKAATFRSVTERETIAGLDVYHPRYFVTPRIGRRYYGALYYWSVRDFVTRLRRSYPFDILDVHWAYPDGYAGVALARELGLPVSISLRGSDIHTYAGMAPWRSLIQESLRAADLVVAVSRSMLPIVQELGVQAEKVSVVANGVDGALFRRQRRSEARSLLGLDPADLIVLAVGRLEKPKRFDLLISACRSMEPDFQLVILGKGSLEESLRALAAAEGVTERVRFVGERPNSELVNWYNAADLCCLASDREGCPNVILECLSCGTPVAASDVGGVAEMISAGETGVVVARNEVEPWRDAIGSALRRRWDRDLVAGSQRGNSWDEVAKTLYRRFQGVISSHSP
jgi:teichuronic acid biosynthesis glycosyltransferase TuaC